MFKEIKRTITDAMKLFLPTHYLRFYPPTFVIKNPLAKQLKNVLSKGSQAVLIVYKLNGIKQLREQLGESVLENYQVELRSFFKKAVTHSVPDDMILSLIHYNSETFGLILRIDDEDERNNLTEIEFLIDQIVVAVQIFLRKEDQLDLQTGYMFIEQGTETIEASIDIAFQRAMAVAEKRIQSHYNEMVFGIRKIINSERIFILAQPIINVSNGEVQAYEMLTRGPKGSLYENPLQLFSIARQTDMLYELELLVLSKVFELIKETGCKQLIFVNFTPMTLGNFKFVKDVESLLYKHPIIKPEQIIIEVTERESIDNLKFILSNIRRLRKKGFRFAVDDTGAGYASLHTISKIMPDIIKIDRSVIQGIDSSRIKESMLKGLILIAREAGSLVVAEGIETKEEANILLKNKVDLAQGFYFAKPNTMPNAVNE